MNKLEVLKQAYQYLLNNPNDYNFFSPCRDLKGTIFQIILGMRSFEVLHLLVQETSLDLYRGYEGEYIDAIEGLPASPTLRRAVEAGFSLQELDYCIDLSDPRIPLEQEYKYLYAGCIKYLRDWIHLLEEGDKENEQSSKTSISN